MVGVSEREDRPRSAAFEWAVDVLGDRCTLLVLYEISAGTHRFNDIQRNSEMPRDRLALRLRRLQAQSLIVRRRYCDHPPRYEYWLTEAGRSLLPALAALEAWGAQHRPQAAGTLGEFDIKTES
jgi:DNA-binding HxlR family transcriptional regulator